MSEGKDQRYQYSSYPRINKLLSKIVEELKQFTEEQAQHLTKLTAIGKALSAQQDIEVILEMILAQARNFTGADGGTLYLVSDDGRELEFHVVHNDTLNTFMGGMSGNPVTLPAVPLFTPEGELNAENVSAYVANTNEIVNIPDVYIAEGFNFQGTRKFDENLKYRSKSMLVVPMQDHEDETIGVLQLINAKDRATSETIPFSAEAEDMVHALASQAAVVITQQRLIREMKELFESFIRAIAKAIEAKSKYTGGHIERVAKLTMMIAEKVNSTREGPFKDVYFTREELDELRIAAWMHDTGKITTPEYVVDKSKKLETVFDRIEVVKTRWQAIRLARELEAERAKLALVEDRIDKEALRKIEEECRNDISALNDDLEFLVETNTGGEFMADDKLARLREIAQRKYGEADDVNQFLDAEEVYNLSIRKGTLTEEERNIMNDHATRTIEILNELPWPRKLSDVPDIAGAHHEKLDGTGYPLGLKAEDINLGSRIMAVADIFEALSAADRPYKEPMKLSKAVQILGFMVKDGHIDRNVVDLFIESGLHLVYAKKFLSPNQIDLDLDPLDDDQAEPADEQQPGG